MQIPHRFKRSKFCSILLLWFKIQTERIISNLPFPLDLKIQTVIIETGDYKELEKKVAGIEKNFQSCGKKDEIAKRDSEYYRAHRTPENKYEIRIQRISPGACRGELFHLSNHPDLRRGNSMLCNVTPSLHFWNCCFNFFFTVLGILFFVSQKFKSNFS